MSGRRYWRVVGYTWLASGAGALGSVGETGKGLGLLIAGVVIVLGATILARTERE